MTNEEPSIKKSITTELKSQAIIAFPLAAMNLAWFAKIAITTAFLGRLGDLQLAGGTLGSTFANVTGFSVLTGLCGAMEPICGQAHGAKNYKLLHKTLLMAILLLLLTSIPISLLWINIDKILLQFGQQRDISILAKEYVKYLLPDLLVLSFLCPLKSYLSTQEVTLPTLFSSVTALILHIPLNILLSRKKGIQGVAMAVWLTDLIAMLILATYIYIVENWKRSEEKSMKSWDKSKALSEFKQLLKLSAPCCLTTCLEWWCWEIMVLLTGKLPNAQKNVSIIAVVLNFDYLLFSIILSIATCASIRVSNELGAGHSKIARGSAFISICISIMFGLLGGLATVGARGGWGSLFSHDKEIVMGVKKMMVFMAMVEVVNVPVTVCGGILRGTGRPLLGMYASLGGFYVVALPLGCGLGFGAGMGLRGLLLGFLAGSAVSAVLLVGFVLCIDWDRESKKAERMVGVSVGIHDVCEDVEGTVHNDVNCCRH